MHPVAPSLIFAVTALAVAIPPDMAVAAASPAAAFAPTGPAVLKREPRFAIAAGRNHAVGVRADGVVETWWENDVGQLGRGTIDAANVDREPLPLPVISGAVAAAAGPGFSFVILADGGVLAWGANHEGQLGIGAPGVLPRPGTAMPPVPAPTRIGGLSGVRQVAAGERFALALLGDGTVMAWGDGHLGALGDGKGAGPGRHYAVPFPRPVPGIARAKEVAAGFDFGLALLEDGTVLGWGANDWGQMGDDAADFKPTPRELPGLKGVRAVAAGGQTAYALLADGSVVAWGRNTDDLLLGPGTQQTGKSSKPLPVKGLRGVVQLSAGHGHVAALLADGTTRTWGYDGYGPLGGKRGADGFARPPLQKVAAVAANGSRTYWLLEDGQVMFAGIWMPDRNLRTPARLLTLAAGGEPPCVTPAPGKGSGGWSIDKAVDRGNLLAALPKAERDRVLAAVDRFRDLSMGAFPQAVSVEASGARYVRESERDPGGPLVFGFEGRYLGAVCDPTTRRLQTVGGTSTIARLETNNLAPLLKEFGELEVGGDLRAVYTLARQVGRIGGLPLYDAYGLHARAVLAAPEGRPPFRELTRREYLEGLRSHWIAQGGEAEAGLDEVERGLVEGIANVKRQLTGEMRDQVVAEMEKGLAQVRAQRAGSSRKLDAGIAEELEHVDDYLAKHGAADLERPAVMLSLGFRGEFHDGQEGAGTLVVLAEDPSGSPSRTAARFLVLRWQWNPGHPRDELWREEFERTFPFGKLGGLVER